MKDIRYLTNQILFQQLSLALYKLITYFRNQTIQASMWDYLKNKANNVVMETSKLIYSPPQTDQFQATGQLSPNQFKKAGDHLVKVCAGWKWKPSSNPNFKSKNLDQQKQYLIYERAICKKRIENAVQGAAEQTIQTSDGDEVIVLQGNHQEKQPDEKDVRYYNMYIIYDEYYFTPRMFFSATDYDGKPIDNELIKQDIQKQYLDKTLTIEQFQFLQNVSMATVHPCKHANVLKSMSDTMRENGQKIESHFALLIFLKFIASVIPTVEFDMTGELHFK